MDKADTTNNIGNVAIIYMCNDIFIIFANFIFSEKI